MTNSHRLSQLEAMLAEEPGDRFLRYAIALEHKRQGHMEHAVHLLEGLLTEDPKYIACYYQLALMQAELGRSTEAVETTSAGALQCLVTGDAKARAELLALKASLLDDDE